MSSELSIFQRARRPLNVLGFGIFFSLTLVFASAYLHDYFMERLVESQNLLSAQKQSLAQKTLDLESIQTRINQFSTLKEQGLVGKVDREALVEQLTTTREKLNMPDTLSYVLEPPQTMNNPVAPESTGEAPTDPDPMSAATHDLDFVLLGISEPELLALLQSYKEAVRGLFRVQACHLANPTPTGLAARCTLRFFNLPEAAKPS